MESFKEFIPKKVYKVSFFYGQAYTTTVKQKDRKSALRAAIAKKVRRNIRPEEHVGRYIARAISNIFADPKHYNVNITEVSSEPTEKIITTSNPNDTITPQLTFDL